MMALQVERSIFLTGGLKSKERDLKLNLSFSCMIPSIIFFFVLYIIWERIKFYSFLQVCIVPTLYYNGEGGGGGEHYEMLSSKALNKKNSSIKNGQFDIFFSLQMHS